MTYVPGARAAENHLRAVNDNHDIANRRIPITPDLDFRRSVFAGHRNIFFRPESGCLFTTRKPTDSILSGPGGSGRVAARKPLSSLLYISPERTPVFCFDVFGWAAGE